MTGVSCRRTAAMTPCRAKPTLLSSIRLCAPATWQMRRTRRIARRELDGFVARIDEFKDINGSEAAVAASTVVERQIVLSSCAVCIRYIFQHRVMVGGSSG